VAAAGVGKRWYSSGVAKGGRDGVAKDSGGRSDCRIFWAAGGLPLPTPDMLVVSSLPGRRRGRISRDRAEGAGDPGSRSTAGETGALAGARVPAGRAAGTGEAGGGRWVGLARRGGRGERGTE